MVSAPVYYHNYMMVQLFASQVHHTIAKELYDRYPDASEGRLAKIRSHVVSRQSCAAVARELRLGERLAAAAGEQLAGDELVALVEKTIADLGATTKREMGKVMGALTAATGGNFDKAQAAKEVGSRLS